MPMFFVRVLALAVALGTALGASARAHDTWVQTNTNVVRTGDVVFIDLLLGNHGNDHRDFKLAGKADPAASTLEVLGPRDLKYDLKERLADNGYAPNEGFWSARFVATEPGLYLVAHTFDKVVSYAPTRAIKSAKTYFVVSPTLDRVQAGDAKSPLVDEPLGHPLEIVARSHPVTPMGPGTPIKLQVLYQGRPLADARVSFIPRGETLSEEFDERYERRTDAAGLASFTPREGNHYLAIVHHLDPTVSGPGYESTKYSAALAVYVPQICPCCE